MNVKFPLNSRSSDAVQDILQRLGQLRPALCIQCGPGHQRLDCRFAVRQAVDILAETDPDRGEPLRPDFDHEPVAAGQGGLVIDLDPRSTRLTPCAASAAKSMPIDFRYSCRACSR